MKLKTNMSSRDSEVLDYAYNPDITWPEAGLGELDRTCRQRERTFLYDLRAQRGDNMERAPERKAYFRGYYWKPRDHERQSEAEKMITEYAEPNLLNWRFWEPKEAPEYNLQLVPTIDYSDVTERHYNAEDIILLQRGTH